MQRGASRSKKGNAAGDGQTHFMYARTYRSEFARRQGSFAKGKEGKRKLDPLRPHADIIVHASVHINTKASHQSAE